MPCAFFIVLQYRLSKIGSPRRGARGVAQECGARRRLCCRSDGEESGDRDIYGILEAKLVERSG
jgi:hypothetical protein